ncbi:MAG: DUF4252 domain-containing protein [Candidatus Krumholzibacteriia bacterium]
MNTRRLLPIVLAALVLSLAVPALAGIKDEPGYIDLGFIEIPADAEEVQDIDLTSMLVNIADDARAEGETELADVLSMVRSVRVKFFSIGDKDDDAVRKNVDRIMKKLDQDDWTRIIYIKDGDETVSVSTKNDKNGVINGLTVVVFEPGDSAGFVNVVGEINLGKLITMSGKFDFDDLDGYMEKYGHGEHGEHVE